MGIALIILVMLLSGCSDGDGSPAKVVYGSIPDILKNDYKPDSLKDIGTLFLDKRKITNITGLWELTNLSALFLHDNQIERIENIGNLVHLEYLDLSKNRIKRIENLQSLRELIELNLSDNGITLIENIESLSNLENLNLNGNPITQISWHSYLFLKRSEITFTICNTHYDDVDQWIEEYHIKVLRK